MAKKSKKKWFRIKVMPEFEQEFKPYLFYRNIPRARQIIDKTFDKNIRLNKIAPIKYFLHSLSIFIVYKYISEKSIKKIRLIINLQPLNSVIKLDTYFLSL